MANFDDPNGTKGKEKVVFQGVDPTKKWASGTAAWNEFKGFTGIGDDYLDEARKLSGYADQSGASEFLGSQWNTLGQEWANRTGNTFKAWEAPTPDPTPTPTPEPTTTPITLPVTDAPTFTAPTYDAPEPFKRPETYEWDPYEAPTWDEVLQQDPGVRARIEEGSKSLAALGAARGNLRSRNTIEGVAKDAEARAAQEYAAAEARNYNRWAANTTGKASVEDRNYGVDRDVYTLGADASGREFDAAFRGAEAEYTPKGLTWQARTQADQTAAGLNFDRDWQREIYTKDDARARDFYAGDDARAREFYDSDDAWRRFQLDEQRRQWLAEMGYA